MITEGRDGGSVGFVACERLDVDIDIEGQEIERACETEKERSPDF